MARGYVTEKVTRFDAEAVKQAIAKSGIPSTKLSSMVLSRDASYLSNAITNAKCNKEDLKKLCEFINLDYNAIVITDEPKEATQTVGNNSNLDLLIVGLNKLVEIEKANSSKYDAILEQIRVTNTKLERIEKTINQISGNVVEVKTVTNANNNVLKDVKSQGAVTNGRLRDMLAKMK